MIIPRQHQGFSLLELLAVLAIIAVVIAFVVPSMSGILRGNDMTRGEQMFQQQLALARQTAVANNRRVEVRLYEFDDPDVVGTDRLYRALQTFILAEDNTAKPLGNVQKLPNTVAINTTTTASTLMNLPDKTFDATKDPQIKLPGVGTTYTAKAFQFRPDGSTNLSSATVADWFITLVSTNPITQVNSTTLPPNFATIQIDRIGGTVRSYRP